MKVRRLRRIVKHILEEPLRVNMSELVHSKNDTVVKDLKTLSQQGFYIGGLLALPLDHVHRWPECGTVACLSGWEILLYGKLTTDDVKVSQERLELPNSSLFFIQFWPNQFRSAIRDEKPGTKAYAQIVAAAVEDYIKTGGWQNRENEYENENQDTPNP